LSLNNELQDIENKQKYAGTANERYAFFLIFSIKKFK